MGGFFSGFTHPDSAYQLESVEFQVVNTDNNGLITQSFNNASGTWSNEDHVMEQSKGYKVKIDNGAAIDNYHGVCIREDEPVNIPFAGQETWLCYYGAGNGISPQDAVGGAFSNAVIKRIAGQYWSYDKITVIIGSGNFQHIQYIWEMSRDIEHYDGVDYGDLIAIKTECPITLVWDEGFQALQTREDETIVRVVDADTDLQYFSFIEQADYNTFIIELDSTDIPQEIAVFADGECIGASVVHEPEVAVFAYVTDDTYNANIDIVKWYGERSEVHAGNPKVYDSKEMKYVDTDVRLDSESKHIRLSFIDKDECITPEYYPFSSSNYPNPFNPSTTIEYSLPESGEVEVSIYNIKGQKVKQLVRECQEPGTHTILWDGKDTENKSVGSGVYFYIVKTERESLINKMIMLK